MLVNRPMFSRRQKIKLSHGFWKRLEQQTSRRVEKIMYDIYIYIYDFICIYWTIFVWTVGCLAGSRFLQRNTDISRPHCFIATKSSFSDRWADLKWGEWNYHHQGFLRSLSTYLSTSKNKISTSTGKMTPPIFFGADKTMFHQEHPIFAVWSRWVVFVSRITNGPNA